MEYRLIERLQRTKSRGVLLCFSNVIVCPATAGTVATASPQTSISEFTDAQRPVLILETSPDMPPEITVTFYLADGVSEFSYSLERDLNDIEATITNPYIDTDLKPATVYQYNGSLHHHHYHYYYINALTFHNVM